MTDKMTDKMPERLPQIVKDKDGKDWLVCEDCGALVGGAADFRCLDCFRAKYAPTSQQPKEPS